MPKHILIVDDNPDEVELFVVFLRGKGISNPIQVVPDGLAAIDYLYGLEPYSNRQRHPFPALIFLDFKMPRRTGHEVLEWLNDHPEVPTPKVIICTNAISHEQLEQCYRLGADFFLLKLNLEAHFRDLMMRYLNIWEFADPSKLSPQL